MRGAVRGDRRRRAVRASRMRAARAGLDAVTVFGGNDTNRYLLETTGCGVAMFDYDGDGLPGSLLRQRHDARGLPERAGAAAAPVSQHGRRAVRGRHR